MKRKGREMEWCDKSVGLQILRGELKMAPPLSKALKDLKKW